MISETLDSIRPEQWRAMSAEDRQAFIQYWRERGMASYQCLTCGFPTSVGQVVCEACI